MATRIITRRKPADAIVQISMWYTKKNGIAEASAVFRLSSKRLLKRQAEMLALRSGFIACFVRHWIRIGGSRASAVRALRNYPYRRLSRG